MSFSVTDSVAESVTLTATDTTDGITLAQTATVMFQTGSPSATASDVVASATTSPADGQTQTLIEVTLKDQFGNAVSGKTVTVGGSPAGNVEIHPVAADVGDVGTPGVTNNLGVADFNADDTHAESVTFTATDTTDNVVVTKTVSVTYTPGPADAAATGTTVTANPAKLAADGSTASTITVTLTDFYSNPIVGKTIALKALNGSSVITPANPVTDQNGQATFSVDRRHRGICDVSGDGHHRWHRAGRRSGGDLRQSSRSSPDAAFCSVVANPTSVPADGSQTATVSILLYDGSGDAVTGKAVTLAGSSGQFQSGGNQCDDQQQRNRDLCGQRFNGGIGQVHRH